MPKSFIQIAEDKMVVPPFVAQVVTAIILFALYFGYYLYNWDRKGRDPKARVIVAEYEAPKNMSPAIARFLMRKTYDDKVLGAQLIDMASRGLVDIQKVDNRKEYRIEKLSTEGRKLTDEDDILLKNLFGKKESLIIDSYATRDTSDRIRLRRTEEILTKHLEGLIYDKLLFKNRAPFWIGVLIVTPLILLGTFIPVVFQEVSVGLIFLFTIPLLLSYAAWTSLISFKFDTKSKKRGILEAIFFVLYRLVLIIVLAVIWFAGYFGTVIALLYFFISISGLVNLALLGALIVTILVFAKLMPRYTEEGARLVEHLKGFKLFLIATEKDRLEFHHPPEKTPELFQKNLGYACAMGVEQKWGAQFGSAIFAATAENRSNQHIHHMSYVTAASFASDFKGFSSVISAAATVPGSRSGGGGGGSSGGGGGGGGGGGW
jgi:uncharacterized membrane protein